MLLGILHDLFFGSGAQRREPQRAHQGVAEHRDERQPGERLAVHEHHAQRHDRHQAVEQAGEEGGGEDALDLVHRAEARHHVAEVATLEVLHRQPHQMREHVGPPLQLEVGAQVQHDPAAQRGEEALQDQQHAEAERQRGEQVAIGRHEHVVDGPLQVERCDQREHLEREGQQQNLRSGAAEAVHPADEVAETHRRGRRGAAEFGGRPQLQGDAGERPPEFVHADLALAARRVVDHDAAWRDLLQHHEVVHVPVQHAGQAQLRQILDIEPQRPACEAQPVGHGNQLAEGRAVLRDGVLAPQRRQVHAVAVVGGHHRETGQAALGGLGLQDDRQAPAQAEGEIGNS